MRSRSYRLAYLRWIRCLDQALPDIDRVARSRASAVRDSAGAISDSQDRSAQVVLVVAERAQALRVHPVLGIRDDNTLVGVRVGRGSVALPAARGGRGGADQCFSATPCDRDGWLVCCQVGARVRQPQRCTLSNCNVQTCIDE